jgi:hypothetical protein
MFSESNSLLSAGFQNSLSLSDHPRGTYCFIVCEELGIALNDDFVSTNLLLFLDDERLSKISGFEITSTTQGSPSDTVPRIVAGAILSPRFARNHPRVVTRLQELIPLTHGDDSTFVFQAGAEPKLIGWMLERAFRLANRFVVDLCRANTEIAGLRRLARDQIEALQLAESSIRAATPATPKLGLVIPASSLSVRLAGQPQPASLSQHSKREFRSVHSFDLYAMSRGERSLSPIKIQMRGANSGKPLASWSIEEREFSEGWNRFDVPPVREPLDEPVIVEVNWEPDSVGSLKLALGEAVADKRWAASGLEARLGDRPIALRIYEGVPGLRLPPSGFNAPPDGPRTEARAGVHNLDHLLSLARFWKGPQGPDKTVIRYMGSEVGLLVHPTGRAPVSAVINRVTLHNAASLNAEVALDHESAADTEFGLFAAPATVSSRLGPPAPRASGLVSLLRLGVTRANGNGMTGGDPTLSASIAWLALRSREEGILSFEFDAPVSGPVDIFLLTRSVRKDTRYAWAHFKHLAVHQSTDVLAPNGEAPHAR